MSQITAVAGKRCLCCLNREQCVCCAQAKAEQAARIGRRGSCWKDSCEGRAHLLSQLAYLVSPLHAQVSVLGSLFPTDTL